MTQDSRTWIQLARRVRRMTNWAWWLHGLGGPLVLMSLLGACVALLGRRLDPLVVAFWTWPAVAVILCFCGLWSWWRQRGHFITENGALIVLEDRYRLHNALTTAQSGHGSWPAFPPDPPPVRKWHWPNTFVPFLVAAALLAAGLLLPVPAPAVATTLDEPPAWKVLEEDLQHLVEQNVIDPKSAEETQQAIEQLRAGGKDEWFKHATLEATDRLLKKHQDSLRALERELRRAVESAAPLTANAPALSPAERQRHQEQLRRALDGLRAAGLQPNAALREQLAKLDPERLGQLDEWQKNEMLNSICQAADALCQRCQGDGEGEIPYGRGGITRGPGEGGWPLGPQSPDLKATSPLALQARDYSRARPGDLLELADHEHQVDEVSPGQQSGGATESRGGGGAAWIDSLHPREQQALKRIFQ